MLNGYADAMPVFTKFLKPPFALLRKLGHLSVVYVDDTYLQGKSFLECMHNLDHTVAHVDKPQLITTQMMTLLGFVIDSTMTIKLAETS